MNEQRGISDLIKLILSALGMIILSFIVIMVLFSSSGSSSSGSINQPTSNQLSVGEIGMLNNNDDISDCSGISSIAFTEEAFDALTDASIAKDAYGYEQIFLQGFATTVENCTEIRVLDIRFAKRKVRVINQPEIVGWVPSEWVVQPIPRVSNNAEVKVEKTPVIKPDLKFGLTEDQRRLIYKEVVVAEDRAWAEAEALYPMDGNNPNFKIENVQKNIDYSDDLAEKYRSEVLQKYNLTKKQWFEIGSEGLKESWPLE